MRIAAPDGSARSLAGRGGVRRRGVRAGVAALLCAVIATPLLGAPAHAASPGPLKVGVVAASDDYLVFAQKRGGRLSRTKGNTLFWIGRTGGRHALPDFDPQLFPDLKGSTLTQSAKPNSRYDSDALYDAAAPEHVRWRDLRTGRHGVAQLPAGDDYVAAADGGWLATRTPASATAPQHLVRYTTSGTVTDLGAPFPAGVPTTSLRRGSAGILAVSARDPEEYSEDGVIGAFRYMPYSTPGRWRDLIEPDPDVSAYCARPSKSAVMCEVYGLGTAHRGLVLIPLNGGKRRWLDAHSTTCQTAGFVVVGSSAFSKATGTGRGCKTGQIVQLTTRGVLITSKRTYGGRGNFTAGLGGFLFSSKDERTVLRLTRAGGAAKVVTTAR